MKRVQKRQQDTFATSFKVFGCVCNNLNTHLPWHYKCLRHIQDIGYTMAAMAMAVAKSCTS